MKRGETKEKFTEYLNSYAAGDGVYLNEVEKETGIIRSTLHSYTRDLRQLDLIETERVTTKFGSDVHIRALKAIPLNWKCRQSAKKTSKSNSSPQMNLNGASKDLEHAVWVIREYVPFLEKQNEDLEQKLRECKEREQDLHRQLNHWAGVFSEAKVIHQKCKSALDKEE